MRYVTYLAVLPALLALSIAGSPWWLLALAAGAAAYMHMPYRRLWPALPALTWSERLYALALPPIIRVVGDVAKMCGYPVGLWWRWRHRNEPAIHWRPARPGR